MGKKKHKKNHKKKKPIDWVEIAIQTVVGLITGIAVLLIEKWLF